MLYMRQNIILQNHIGDKLKSGKGCYFSNKILYKVLTTPLSLTAKILLKMNPIDLSGKKKSLERTMILTNCEKA